ncbi:MAG: enoyl-CoA hydratase-related protein [Dehalococcoidia bacterium]|nr:enoyl-CoA hydratase-related protein [Dehalococcoidia bacterium]
MSEPQALYKVEGPIGIITLNRTDTRNAFSWEMVRLIQQFLDEASADDKIKVLILTANGAAFCAGADVREFAEGRLRGWVFKNFMWEGLHHLNLTLTEDMDKPIIAAVNGPAIGAGMDMALACDMRVSSDKAKFAESYINMGIIAGDGGAYLLSRLVGIPKALELMLTGDMLSAEEAFALGIVNKVVPHERLLAETMVLAEKIASKPPLAVRMMKRSVYQAQNSSFRSHLDCVSSHNAMLSETEDHQEAASAFMEKRKPTFKGK